MTDKVAGPDGSALSEGLGPQRAKMRPLPCPFCGSHDVMLTHDAARWPVVQCQDCGANGPSIKLSSDEAVAQWNARPGVASERERCARLCEAARPAGGRAWDVMQSACFDALTHVAAVIRGPNGGVKAAG